MNLGLKILVSVVILIGIIIMVVVGIFVVGTNTLMEGMLYKQALSANSSIAGAIEDYQSESLRKAESIAKNETVVESILSGDTQQLQSVLISLGDGLDLITLCDENGIALARSHSDKKGDDVSNQEALTTALKTGTGIKTIEPGSVVGLSTRGSAAIRDEFGNIIGALTCGYDLSKTEYVDKIKAQSNCEVTIFVGDERMNTTLIDEKGERVIGTKASENVVETVIKNKQNYSGSIELFGSPYQVLYSPLLANDKVVGMLFAGVNIEDTLASQSKLLKIVIVSAGVIMILSLAIIFGIVNRTISRPLKVLTALSSNLAEGELNIQADKLVKRKDEIGHLSKNFIQVVEALKVLKEKMDQMKEWAVLGKLTERVEDDERVLGEYREIVHSVNRIADVLIDHINIIPVPIAFVDKDYGILFINRAGLEKTGLTMEGAKAQRCYQCLNTSGCNNEQCPGRRAMASGNVECSELTAGPLEVQMHSMPFRDEAGSIAGFMEIIIDQTQIKLAQRDSERQAENVAVQMMIAEKQANYQAKEVEKLIVALEQLAEGSLSVTVAQADFDDDTKAIYDSFKKVGDCLETSCTNIRGYINELSDVLGNIADKNLNVGITREYLGDFTDLKVSINNIVDTLNEVFAEIAGATNQVQDGSQQVANSSQTLARGASEQASAVEEISATVTEVSAQTKSNAENAHKANEISLNAKTDAETGNNRMDEMVKAMDAIKEASKGIASIIKVIEDIAFQTNILALNAAVEAARAGEHGKGFAVVAEEVRTLAARSAEAAKETTEMIDNSLARVEVGSKIAGETAEALNKIVSGVTGTVDIVATIAEASEQQATAIAQIDNGIDQISKVTQSTTAVSEESASASQEMAGQAQMLQSMIDGFTLKAVKSGKSDYIGKNAPAALIAAPTLPERG